MNFNKLCVFIPISDTDRYHDWDGCFGYGGTDQLDVDDGIIVLKSREDDFRSQVAIFETYAKRYA